jgi:hypothetical protein
MSSTRSARTRARDKRRSGRDQADWEAAGGRVEVRRRRYAGVVIKKRRILSC